MWAWLVGFGAIGVLPLVGDGLPVAPVDVEIGRQTIALQRPLFARTPGARLVLYIRDMSNLDVSRSRMLSEFETAVPAGSVTAYLTGDNDERLTLEHTGYSYYRGYAGLVLSQAAAPAELTLYRHLEVDAKLALRGVRFVWLERGGSRVEDVEPAL